MSRLVSLLQIKLLLVFFKSPCELIGQDKTRTFCQALSAGIFYFSWSPFHDFHPANPNFDASEQFTIGIGFETGNSIVHQTPNSISIWSIVLALTDTRAGGGVVLIGIWGIGVWIYRLPFAPVYVCALGSSPFPCMLA